AAFAVVAKRHGVPISHVKPHGALHHAASRDTGTATAVLFAMRDTPGCGHATLVGACGSEALVVWRSMGAQVMGEAFADRAYEADGSLRTRSHADALIADPAK